MLPVPASYLIIALTAAGVLAQRAPLGAQIHPRVQDADHHHHAREHAGVPVDCGMLAAPPWIGLPDADRELIRRVEASMAELRTPEAAARAGFVPALGNVPTMGVHWVNERRMQQGFEADEPDHLMFAPRDGKDELVGVAYAFRGAREAVMPEAFQSELAHWHDHPMLGGSEQTMHMLHVWLVPSPYGPFAGNNFFLPFHGRGVTPPDACWLSRDADVERFEQVASVLALVEALESLEGRALTLGAGRQPGGASFLRGPLLQQLTGDLERLEDWVVDLDVAARNGDRDAWTDAATRMLDALTPVERRVMEVLRRSVKGVQEPSARPLTSPAAPPGQTQ